MQNSVKLEWSKRISIGLCHATMAGTVALGVFTKVPQVLLALMFVGGFVPYLIHLHYVSPRLTRRREDKDEA